MAGRRAGAGLALAAIALTAAGCGIGGSSTKTVTRTVTRTVTTTRTVTAPSTSAAACTGSQLAGSFAYVPGSQGAGQIGYALTLTNTSATECSLTIQTLVLLDANGSQLPTKSFGAWPSALLAPGASTSATARFSPDVPSKGDSQGGSCQPKAHTLQVTPTGGGQALVPIKPATSVCGQGSLVFPSN